VLIVLSSFVIFVQYFVSIEVWDTYSAVARTIQDVKVEGKGMELDVHGRTVNVYFIESLEHSSYWHHTICKNSSTPLLFQGKM